MRSIDIDASQSVYLLGKKPSSSYFQRYTQLIEMCMKEGEFLSFEEHSDWLSCYARDAQPLHTQLPLLVFRPYGIMNIAPFLRVCHQLAIPVTVRCGGTSLVGGSVPSKEGIILLTGHLKQIRNYDGKKGTVCVEPGVTIRQLNQYVAREDWQFPLSMATEGVAGIAGCLSCNSRGYQQQLQAIYDGIEQVTLVDGQGQVLEVPASLVCGAEGLWGVIIELKIQLKKKSDQRQEFIYTGTWQEVLSQLSLLRSIQTLTCIIWNQTGFYLRCEGDAWRLPSTATYLAKCLPGIQSAKTVNPLLLSSRQAFITISSALNTDHLPEACAWAIKKAQEFQLQPLLQADLLSGNLQLILQAQENLYSFGQKIEQFLVLWTSFVDQHQGTLASCHGVGMQMAPYMPPFWKEESQLFWRHLQVAFDPKELFVRERFFPPSEKSLEKVRQ
jgi:glycolate oxidase